MKVPFVCGPFDGEFLDNPSPDQDIIPASIQVVDAGKTHTYVVQSVKVNPCILCKVYVWMQALNTDEDWIPRSREVALEYCASL